MMAFLSFLDLVCFKSSSEAWLWSQPALIVSEVCMKHCWPVPGLRGDSRSMWPLLLSSVYRGLGLELSHHVGSRDQSLTERGFGQQLASAAHVLFLRLTVAHAFLLFPSHLAIKWRLGLDQRNQLSMLLPFPQTTTSPTKHPFWKGQETPVGCW